MNINQAKEFIKQTVGLYLEKDETGDYVIPVSRQRPVFLLGAPGVGKTAIMEQIAAELGIALVSYSMTHHTRQSAIGLPMIRREIFDGIETDVTEYTMSEIIVSVYETMKQSGIPEGILFLDEINCVSETLAPSMLQFLQYKVFGRHAVPDGWIIVTAGNPPEFNKSVREFDVAVMDRLKVISVEPDFNTFKQYAMTSALHPTIIDFLDINRDFFYKVENTPDGRTFVTARGWEDLSEMLILYEKKGYTVDENLVSQYIHNKAIVREFTAYYELYNKYKTEYLVSEILDGTASEEYVQKASVAPADEKLSLISMLSDRVIHDVKLCMVKTDYLAETASLLKVAAIPDRERVPGFLDSRVESLERAIASKKKALALTKDEEGKKRHVIIVIKHLKDVFVEKRGSGYEVVKKEFDEMVKQLKEGTEVTKKELANLFGFTDTAFGEGTEMEVLVTRLTANPYTRRFISRFGSEEFERFKGDHVIEKSEGEMTADIASLFDDIPDKLKGRAPENNYMEFDDIIGL